MGIILMDRLVIVGGSFGGLEVLKHLHNRESLEIMLIDQNPYHYLQPEVYGYVAGSFKINDVIIDLYTLCASYGKNIHFVQLEIEDIDFDNNALIYNKIGRIEYDYLVIATGSRTFFPQSVVGLGDVYTGGIKSIANAMIFKQKFEQNMYKIIQSEGVCSVASHFNVVVGGAGLSGIETAAEMVWYAKSMYRDFGYLCSGVNVILISSSDTVLKGSHPYLIKKSTQRLLDLGVKIIYNERIVNVTPESITLSSGKTLDMDFLIWTGGIVGSALVQKLDIDKNERHFIKVDEYCRVKENVFAIGDAAILKDPISKQKIPPTSQAAELSGRYVAKNIARLLDGKDMKIEPLKMSGMFVALGGKYGAGVIFDKLFFSGYIAYLLKQAIFKMYKFPLISRCKRGYKKSL